MKKNCVLLLFYVNDFNWNQYSFFVSYKFDAIISFAVFSKPQFWTFHKALTTLKTVKTKRFFTLQLDQPTIAIQIWSGLVWHENSFSIIDIGIWSSWWEFSVQSIQLFAIFSIAGQNIELETAGAKLSGNLISDINFPERRMVLM